MTADLNRPPADLSYPAAEPGADTDLVAGRTVADPYRWLEDGASERTTGWVAEQQRLAEDYLGALDGQPELLRLMRSLLRRPPGSPSKIAGDLHFRVGQGPEETGWALEVRTGADDGWRPLLDRSALGTDCTISRWQPSPRGRYLAVQVVEAGSEASTPLSIVDVGPAEIVQTLGLVRYSAVEWRADETRFYYVRRNLDGPGSGVYLHRLGEPAERDELVIGESDPVIRYSLELWHDRWLVIGVRRGAAARLATLVQDLDEPDAPLRELGRLGHGSTAVLVDGTGRFLATSTSAARFGEVYVADSLAAACAGDWTLLIAEQAPAVLTAITLVPMPGGSADRLAVLRTRDACSELTVHDAGTGHRLVEVELPGYGTITSVRPSGVAAELLVTYTDWTTPMSIWTVDMVTGRCWSTDPEAQARQPVTVVRDSYPAADGTAIPVTVLTRADDDRARNGTRPTLLTCYGGFGLSVSPGFQADSLTWVLAGGRMAVAGVRGGGERGREWHLAGSGRNKPTSFADLHAAGDWLVRTGWTRRDQLALLGGSNGGLMVTGAVAQRPEDYAALASAGAPLDMVRYPLSGLGRAWLQEYGSPDDPELLPVLLSYSPYHNVDTAEGRSWPAALFSVGSNDTRVDPLHSRKLVARLQAQAPAGGPVLLTTLDGAGHVSTFNARTEQLAVRLLAFLARHTGLEIAAG